MVGWAVRVVAAFLTNGFEERIGVDFKRLRALASARDGLQTSFEASRDSKLQQK